MSGRHFILIERMVRWAARQLEEADPYDPAKQAVWLRVWNYWQMRWLRALRAGQ